MAVQKLVKGHYLEVAKKGSKAAEGSSLLRLGSNGRLLQESLRGRICMEGIAKSKQHCQSAKLQGFLSGDDHGQVCHLWQEQTENPDEIVFKVASEGNPSISIENDVELKQYSVVSRQHWKMAYQKLLQSRRKLWKSYLVNPWSLTQEQTDAINETPKSSILCCFEDQKYGLANPLLMERTAVIDHSRLGFGSTELEPEKVKVVETCSCLGSGLLALLLDAARKRQFLESTRLALHIDIAPHQVSFLVAEKSLDQDTAKRLHELKEFLTLSAQEEGIRVRNEADSLEKADLCGIPFTVILSKSSLESGIVHLRDRETCSYFEEIHLAHLLARLVKIYRK